MLWAACCMAFLVLWGQGSSRAHWCNHSQALCCHLVTFQLIRKRTRLWCQFIFRNLKQAPLRQEWLFILAGRITPSALCRLYCPIWPGEDQPMDRSFCLRMDLLYPGRALCSTLGDPWILTAFDSSGYAGHSCRVGMATAAALAWLEDSAIRTLGRWCSRAFLRYIRSPALALASASHRLCPALNSSSLQWLDFRLLVINLSPITH